jgi:ferrous iron transport protein B
MEITMSQPSRAEPVSALGLNGCCGDDSKNQTGSSECTIRVALVGQPNVGKSTVFNLLTGLSQHVGNWPGKTVERKDGIHRCDGTQIQIVDLPGTYSLTANSLEERITRDYIIRERPDVVVMVADAASLERNLYLLSEMLCLPSPVVLALNMVDVAHQQGVTVEPHVLEAALGMPVVSMIATKNQGVRELMETVMRVHEQGAYGVCRPDIREDHRAVLNDIAGLIAGHVPDPYPEDWMALKLLEGDEEITALMQANLSAEQWERVHQVLMHHEDAILAIAGGRYEWVRRMTRAALTTFKAGQITVTDRMDKVATHPLGGLALLLGVMGVIFWLTYAIGSPLQSFLDTYIVQASAQWVRTALAGAPWWLSGVLADGIIGGAGMVLTFLPILAIFFAVLGVLEDVGYMSRAAYVMDRFMHLMGLHGKSFLPLFLGFGCNVPAVMGSRIVDSPKARLLTILLAPLVPCTARMAVVAVLAPIFFGSAAIWVSWGLIALSLVVLALVGIALHELVLGGEHVAFIMELPLYHQPNARTIGLSVWQRTMGFVKKAGSIILVVSVIVWALSVLPGGQVETSYLAAVGRFLAPLGALLGVGWQMMVALLASVVAKENTIAVLSVLLGAGKNGAGLAQVLPSILTPASALAFLVVQVLFIPCAATVATIRQETRSWKWTAASVGILLVISFAVGIGVYQLARLVGWGV